MALLPLPCCAMQSRRMRTWLMLSLLMHSSNDLARVFADDGATPFNGHDSDEEPVINAISDDQRQQRRTFRAANSNVHVVSNFLPHDLAVKWRDAMKEEWLLASSSTAPGDSASTCKSEDSAADTCAGTSSAWRYATNNDGSGGTKHNNNAKVRSIEDIAARNATAQKMRRNNMFSYAKWELDPSHALVKEMEASFCSEEIRNKVASIIMDEQAANGESQNDIVKLAPELSDLFVTHYSVGDFLTPHNDGMSGIWAFVISLMDGPSGKEWNGDEFGGSLRFECPFDHPKYRQQRDAGNRYATQWCESLAPGFNTAVFFRTIFPKGMGPVHEVLPVTSRAQAEGFHRFGLTGWYLDDGYDLPESVKAERDKMRAQ